MPELAEVETVRRQVEKHMTGLRIQEVDVDGNDRYLYAFAPAKDVAKALTGAKITGTGRKGKYFWLKLDRKPWPIFHLGMSGNIALLDPKARSAGHEKIWGGAKLWSERDEDLKSKLFFTRLMIHAKGGLEFAFIDPRRFGRMWLSEVDPLKHPLISRLGYDPLLDWPSAKVLGEKLKKRKKAIKSVLLDQNLFAGIGNWLADEILFQAKLAPQHLASQLKPVQVRALDKATLLVVKKAVAVKADYEQFPENWLFHHRWGKGKAAKISTGKAIKFEEIGGRTTAWVPGVQK